MAGPSRKMRVSDEVLPENEYNDIFESKYSSDIEINVKITSCSEQSVSTDEQNVNGNSSMQHGVWSKSGARFSFTGKPGINVDLEDPRNPPEYFELFRTSEIAEVTARETNRYAPKCSENTPNLKLRAGTHHWKESNRNETTKLLTFFLLQGLHQKPDNKSYFPHRKILETYLFLDLFSERRFHLQPKFLHLIITKRINVMRQGTTAKTVRCPCGLHRFQRYSMAADF
jgi:hypothetical protein